jgi:hypothetical protein
MVPGAYKLRVFLLFLVTSAILSGCSKTNYRWLYYDETYCADKWDRHMVNEKLKEYRELSQWQRDQGCRDRDLFRPGG